MDDFEDRTSNPRVGNGAPTIGAIVEARLSRRGFLTGAAAFTGLAASGCATADEVLSVVTQDEANRTRFDFPEIARGSDATHHVPAGYEADLVIRWGDPLFSDSPAFDPMAQTADAQAKQFGYNNDFIGYVPLANGPDGSERALLCVNHEYTSTLLMFPGVAATYPQSMTKELCAVEMAAHGGTIVEVTKTNAGWRPVVGSRFNRRITADTPMTISGPAAGHARMRTSADATGRAVFGTLNNCAGGITPWGTYLMAEENFNSNFLGAVSEDDPQAAHHARYGVPGARYQWGRHFDRFDLSKEPNEPNRFGWVVEVDPMDPTSTPVKRTALGRFKHEGAESVLAPDGRVVIYMGDDQRFDYVYKFVSARAYDAANPAANSTLLDEGTLYVARFDADGSVDWMPLIWGEGPLTPANGFDSQGEVLIETRRAADLLGATPMDRPEDVEPDPARGRVFVMLTNNSRRGEDQIDAANPRAENNFGHIIEIVEPDGDFAATRSTWEIVVRCGDPAEPLHDALWNPDTSRDGWFTSPDNCALDPSGRLWIATDGNERSGANDGVWALETDGEGRGTGRAFFRCPVGAELCGPRFNEAGDVLFVAVQHPGDTEGATFEAPGTRWPDFREAMPPRPSVLALRRRDGGPVGG